MEELAGNLEGEADWDLDDLTGGLALGNQASIRGNHRSLREMCSVVHESIASLAGDLLYFAIRCVEEMSRACIMKVLSAGLESTLSTRKALFGELESPLASKNSEFGAAVAELESTGRRLCFPKDADRLTQKQIQSQGCTWAS